jgi:nitrite reductase/ring-hydroxylating ferredoxin subunit
MIEDGCCVCPWHGWAFRLDSGELRDAPGVMIRTYPTRLLHRDGHPTLVQADLPMP